MSKRPGYTVVHVEGGVAALNKTLWPAKTLQPLVIAHSLGIFWGGVSCGIATADMTSMASRGVSLVEVDSRLLDII